MLEILIPEFAATKLVGENKKLTTSPLDSSEFVDVCGEMVRVIHAESVHKCLGRNLTGSRDSCGGEKGGGKKSSQERYGISRSFAGCLKIISQT